MDEILIVGDYLGFGSVREQPILALKQCDIKIILAKSYSNFFYLNAFNNGLLCLECNTDHIADNDEIIVDLEHFIVRNLTTNKGIKIKTVNPFLLELYKQNGIINYIKNNENNLSIHQESPDKKKPINYKPDFY